VVAADFDPYAGPRPVAVFVQTDPWLLAIGSDNPRVAIYENGDVVFTRKVEKMRHYFHITLDGQGLLKLREHFRPLFALKDLKKYYDIAPTRTDQPEAMFYFRDGDRVVATTVRGLMVSGTRLPAFTEFGPGPQPTVPPAELLKVHKTLAELDYPEAKKWTPKYVEVILWDFSSARDPVNPWPPQWPGLKSDRAVGSGDSYSIYLDGALWPKVNEFMDNRKGSGAVEIGGMKMAASVRFTFPSEPVWRKALEPEEEQAKEREEDKAR